MRKLLISRIFLEKGRMRFIQRKVTLQNIYSKRAQILVKRNDIRKVQIGPCLEIPIFPNLVNIRRVQKLYIAQVCCGVVNNRTIIITYRCIEIMSSCPHNAHIWGALFRGREREGRDVKTGGRSQKSERRRGGKKEGELEEEKQRKKGRNEKSQREKNSVWKCEMERQKIEEIIVRENIGFAKYRYKMRWKIIKIERNSLLKLES